MNEETLEGIGEMGEMLAQLFEREADALEGNSEPRMLGRKEAYQACAEACYKATTRRMIVWPECTITFRVPSEAKP